MSERARIRLRFNKPESKARQGLRRGGLLRYLLWKCGGIRLDVIASEATLCQEQCSCPGIHKNIGATPENKLSGSGVSKPRWAFCLQSDSDTLQGNIATRQRL